MALKYGIFPGVKIGTTDDGLPISDRAVDDAYFARYHSMFLSNGVYGKSSSCGQVLAGSGMELVVQPIDVFINGWYAYDLDPETLTLSAASESRTDIVVAQLNIPDRLIKIYVKSGTTDLTRTNDIWELCLAQVAISKEQTVIVQSAIRDTRLDNNLCGIVSGIIKQTDPSTLLAQMESWFADQKAADEADFKHWYDTFTTQSKSDFDTWFAGIKDVLDSNTAGNLLNQINKKVDKSALMELVYPVGFIYASRQATSPASLFGGTWQRIKDVFLLAAGDTYATGSTGGEATHSLTIDEIPAHKHSASKAGFIEQTYGDSACYTQAPGWDGNYWGVSSYSQTEATGGGKAHNNMPPYLTVYIWERLS